MSIKSRAFLQNIWLDIYYIYRLLAACQFKAGVRKNAAAVSLKPNPMDSRAALMLEEKRPTRNATLTFENFTVAHTNPNGTFLDSIQTASLP